MRGVVNLGLTERPGNFEIDDKLEDARLKDGQIGGLSKTAR